MPFSVPVTKDEVTMTDCKSCHGMPEILLGCNTDKALKAHAMLNNNFANCAEEVRVGRRN
jgi:hypothetical protein